VRSVTVDVLLDLLASPDATEELSLAHGCAAVVVSGGEWPVEGLTSGQRHALEWLPCVTVAPASGPDWRLFDVVADPDDVVRQQALVDAVSANPQAGVALVRLLRAARQSDPHTGLWAESVTYAMLQAGPEFASWRAAQPSPAAGDDVPGGRVRVTREGGAVVVMLDRPARHNALGVALRDALVDALRAVAADPSVESVMLRGAGPSFCSGGDLAEFATFPDPVTAHVIRSTRLPARAVHDVRRRLTAQVHGACIGAGVELAAFAETVIADPDTTFRLPEVGMGLVPGSGGTWSITRRIGSQRTAWLALTGAEIDAPTALAWGLIDRIDTATAG